MYFTYLLLTETRELKSDRDFPGGGRLSKEVGSKIHTICRFPLTCAMGFAVLRPLWSM